jgi:hypothetical protein
MSINNDNQFKTIEDYIAYWNEQSLETLQAIAAEHMGGYAASDTQEELVAYLASGMEKCCEEQSSR